MSVSALKVFNMQGAVAHIFIPALGRRQRQVDLGSPRQDKPGELQDSQDHTEKPCFQKKKKFDSANYKKNQTSSYLNY